MFAADLDVQNLNEVDRSRLWVHAVQLLPQRSFRDNETIETVSLEPGASSTTIIPVVVSHQLDFLNETQVIILDAFRKATPWRCALHSTGLK